MRVIVYGILMASYLSISYRLKELVIQGGGMLVEMLITLTLVLSVILSQTSEFFVWLLITLMAIQQMVQLKVEANVRIKRQRLQQQQEEVLDKAA